MKSDTMRVTLPADSVPTDTITADTIQAQWGVVIDSPRPLEPVREPDTSMSWVIVVLLLCFVAVSIRFRNNGKYIVSIWKDITEVRERRNIFDETVRETSFMVLLNILWIAEASILLGMLLMVPDSILPVSILPEGVLPGESPTDLFTMTVKGALPAVVIYTILMFFGYWVVGNVFSDSVHTRMWVRGYGAMNSLVAVVLFPIVLLALCYPQQVPLMLIIAGILFVFAKILFFYKGFRIFFSQGSSWVLFLYYLCSLEIVPLILLYVSAQFFARVL